MTYEELVASIRTWLSRTDQDGNIPTFIRNVEARVNRDLRVREMVARATASIDVEFADLPLDFLAPRSAAVGDRALEYLMPDDMLNVRRGGPTWAYTVLGEQIQFAPAPVSADTVELTYYQRLKPIGENATNWLLRNHSDAYLYGALVEAAVVTRDEVLMAMAEGKFQDAKRRIEAGSSSLMGDRMTPLASTVV